MSAEPVEVVFTSGGTEADNLGIKGLFWKRQEDRPRRRILVPGGEHHATIDAVEWLAAHDGAELEWLPIEVPASEHTRKYLKTKTDKLGHRLDSV